MQPVIPGTDATSLMHRRKLTGPLATRLTVRGPSEHPILLDMEVIVRRRWQHGLRRRRYRDLVSLLP